MLRVFFSILCGWWFLCILRFIKLFQLSPPLLQPTHFTPNLCGSDWDLGRCHKQSAPSLLLNFILLLHTGWDRYSLWDIWYLVKSQNLSCWDLKDIAIVNTWYGQVLKTSLIVTHRRHKERFFRRLALSPFSTWCVFHTTSTTSGWRQGGRWTNQSRGRRVPRFSRIWPNSSHKCYLLGALDPEIRLSH